MSAVIASQYSPTAKASRRANSCQPCRESKSKCSEGIPCSTCRKKRGQPTCHYSISISQSGEDHLPTLIASPELRGAELYTAELPPEVVRNIMGPIDEQDHNVIGSHEDFCGTFSLARSVEEYKQLSSSAGQFQEIIDSLQPAKVFNAENSRVSRAPTTLTSKSRQERRKSTFQLSPLLQHLYMKYHFVQDLLNDGLATRAWSAFASLIRDSELYGLKEHAILKTATDETVDPEPSRQLWWLFIELDVQLSFLLGRQPYIDASHGVPKPILEKMLDEGKGCQQDVLDFTDFMIETSNRAHKHRNNWRSFPEDSEATSTWLQSILDQLQRHYSKILHLPPVNLDKTTLSVLAQHQIDVQLALMVFSGQMLRSIIPEKEWSGRFRDRRKSASKGYYDRLLKNLRTIIDIFDYSHRLDPDIAASSWPRCFGFFSAALMLGITQLQQDGDIKLDKERLQTALRIFSSLAADGQALGIAQYATESLAEILQALKKLRQQTSGSTAVYDAPFIPNEATECSNDPHQATSGRNARSIPKARPDSVTKCRDASHFQEDTHARKIFRPEEMITPCESFGEALNSIWKGSHHHYPQPMLAGPVLDVIPRASSQPESFEQRLFTQTASTSFNSQMNFPEAGYSPNRVANFADYSGVNHETHLPMTFAPLPHDTIFQSLFQTDGNFMWALDPQLLYHHVPMTSSTSQAYTIGDALQSNQCPGFDHMQPMFPSQAQDMIMANTHNVLPIDSTSVIRRALRIPTQVSEFSVPIAQKSPGEAAVQIDVSFPRSPESDLDTAAEVHQ